MLIIVSQDKLIKQGLKYTDSLFLEIENRLKRGVLTSDTLESFLIKTKDYTVSNPLVMSGFKDKLLSLILSETNNHKFTRPAQKELTRVVIENSVGEKITSAGDDLKNNIREIVKQGYNNNLPQDEIADNIVKQVRTIKNTRARTIARTEIARTATISDYIINKERGATHFTVDCRETCCEVCRLDYNFGKMMYTIDDVSMLPPRHPNCRCVAFFHKNENPTGGGINWTYEYEDTKYEFIGNTPWSREEFLEKFGVNLNELTKEEKLFLQIFTQDSSPLNRFYRLENKTLNDYLLADVEWKKINNTLINKGVISGELSLSDALTIVEDIFDKYSVPVDKDIILCRRERKRYTLPDKNGNYTDKGFTSTSIYESAKEEEYGDEISYILIPKGTPILYLEGLTSSKEDFEVLFPPNINLVHVEDLGSKKKVWRYS